MSFLSCVNIVKYPEWSSLDQIVQFEKSGSHAKISFTIALAFFLSIEHYAVSHISSHKFVCQTMFFKQVTDDHV
jgi:hypothetical protein